MLPRLSSWGLEYTYLDICCRNVANHIQVVVHHHDRRHAFIVHDLKSLTQGLIAARK